MNNAYYVFSSSKAIFLHLLLPTCHLKDGVRYPFHVCPSYPVPVWCSLLNLGRNCLITGLCTCLALSTNQWLIYWIVDLFVSSDMYILTCLICLKINDVLSVLLVWGHNCHRNSYLCWAAEYNLILGKYLFIEENPQLSMFLQSLHQFLLWSHSFQVWSARSSTVITRALIRNAEAQAPPRPTESEPSLERDPTT